MVASEDLRAGGGGRAAHDEHILDADGDAGQRRQRLTRGDLAVDALRLREGAVTGERKHAVDVLAVGSIFGGDAREVLLSEGDGGGAAVEERRAHGGDRLRRAFLRVCAAAHTLS